MTIDLSPLLYLIALVVLAAVIKAAAGKAKHYNYRKNQVLLTPAELNFFHALYRQLPKKYGISTKVRLADLLTPNERGKRYKAALARIWSKHIDFVIYEIRTGKIISGIELDDSSHKKINRIARDKFVNQIAEESGFILHRVKNRRAWKNNDIEQLIPSEVVKVDLQGAPPLISPGPLPGAASTQGLRGRYRSG